MARLQLSLLALFSICLLFSSGVFSQSTFTIINLCSYPVWPALISDPGAPQPPSTGFLLEPNYYNILSMPAGWSGNLWGRTLCTTDSKSLFSCVTGDCGSGTIECTNSGAPPVTIANIKLDGASGLDYYGVSLVNGFNVPLVVIPANRIATCIGAGCSVDINPECPTVLQDIANGGETVACKSGCVAFGDPMDCCTGAYSTNNTCGPTQYSKFFKSLCPLTNTYAFDNGTFTCTESPDYTIGFCEL